MPTYSVQWTAQVTGESSIEANSLEEARELAEETDHDDIDFYPLEDTSNAVVVCVINNEDEKDAWDVFAGKRGEQ